MRRIATVFTFGVALAGLTVVAPSGMTPVEAAPSAARIYASKCASCHAPDGKGNIGGTPNFRDGGWHASRSDDNLIASIRDGKGNLMPAWGKELTPAQIIALVRHVRSLKR
ncbi:MAG: c-type cytochrome [Blastocatellia bacterium]|jgi:cytochrome c oxidase cbb3-type subunit 3|nr:c-type cytochrome [Blastocatellia bacterium]